MSPVRVHRRGHPRSPADLGRAEERVPDRPPRGARGAAGDPRSRARAGSGARTEHPAPGGEDPHPDAGAGRPLEVQVFQGPAKAPDPRSFLGLLRAPADRAGDWLLHLSLDTDGVLRAAATNPSGKAPAAPAPDAAPAAGGGDAPAAAGAVRARDARRSAQARDRCPRRAQAALRPPVAVAMSAPALGAPARGRDRRTWRSRSPELISDRRSRRAARRVRAVLRAPRGLGFTGACGVLRLLIVLMCRSSSREWPRSPSASRCAGRGQAA
jgi:hypothetical protein